MTGEFRGTFCKHYNAQSKADVKRHTGYCKAKNMNIIGLDCDDCERFKTILKSNIFKKGILKNISERD